MKFLTVLLLCASPGVALAQAPVSAENHAPAPPARFEYAAEGRRDPFINLVGRGTDAGVRTSPRVRPDGLQGVSVEEVVVRGILYSRGDWIAMIGAPNGRTYAVRPGDSLLDGSVQAITAEAVVLLQEVNDPLSLAKQREVRKYLRGEVK